MLKFNWRTLTLIVAAALTLAAGSANAAYVSYSCTVITGPTELSGTLECPQYAGAGTLTSIDLTVSGEITGSITLTNNAETQQTVTGTTTSLFFQDPPLSGDWTPPMGSPLFTVSFTTGSVTLDPGETRSFVGLLGSGSWNGVYTGDLSSYIGSDNVGVPIYTQTAFALIGGGGQVGSNQSTAGTVAAIIGYTFRDGVDEVPEPQSWAMLTGGIALLGLARIRRRSV